LVIKILGRNSSVWDKTSHLGNGDNMLNTNLRQLHD
jgi:hypothetical protein